ncbi:VOC family protein [Aestuariibius sp. 2305UL40-4]|uniref:VOC family protein n=1 Tax=Aestuariibius violaceus TaxID=3234132 RepID=UPI00345E3C21
MPVKNAAILHFSVCVDDLDRSVAFYGAAFGFAPTLLGTDLGDAFARMVGSSRVSARLAQLTHGTRHEVLELIAIEGQPGAAAGPTPLAHVAFQVPNLTKAIASAEAEGAAPLGEVVTFAEGRSVYCREPGGSVFELEELF